MPEDNGQVSEASGMDEAGAGEPIQPDQAVAGAPDAESGEVEEGTAGPNARPHHDGPDDDEPTQEPGRPL